MKRVYFVRHGQTKKNIQSIHQGPEEPLNETGEAQAQKVAGVLSEKQIDTIITSPFVRARETAAIISDVLNIPYIEAECVKEFRRPASMYGKSHFTPSTFYYVWQLFWNRGVAGWDNEGAENMFNIRNRILDTKRLIAEQSGERIVIVSHAIYIDMFVQAVCADRSLTMWEFFGAFLGAKKLPNTAMVAFEVDETAPPETCNWWLVKEETSPQYLKYR